MTKIPWTEETINPWVGCTKIRAGCKNCYAEKMAIRLKAIAENDLRKKSIQSYKKVISCIDLRQGWNGKVVKQPGQIEKVLKRRKPTMFFWGSMTDIFHEAVPFEWIDDVMAAIALTPQHTHQILTKRIGRAAEYYDGSKRATGSTVMTESGLRGRKYSPETMWPLPNLWIGPSISTQEDADLMIPIALQIPSAVRLVSIEPLLEWIRLDTSYFGYSPTGKLRTLNGRREYQVKYDKNKSKLDLVILGCESGPGARLCSLDDIRFVRDQVVEAGVPLFIKQIPLKGKCSKKPEEWPEEFRIQEYPK